MGELDETESAISNIKIKLNDPSSEGSLMDITQPNLTKRTRVSKPNPRALADTPDAVDKNRHAFQPLRDSELSFSINESPKIITNDGKQEVGWWTGRFMGGKKTKL